MTQEQGLTKVEGGASRPITLTKGQKISLTKLRHIDFSNLRSLYLEQRLSLAQIALLKGCSQQAVAYWCRSLNIPIRKRWEHLKGKRGKGNPNWKGGKRKDRHGYVYLRQPNHPHAHNGYIAEHRLVMEQKLGRFLYPSEKVHHINGIKNDNRPENLLVLSSGAHTTREMVCRNCALKKELRLLRWQVKDLREALQSKLKEV